MSNCSGSPISANEKKLISISFIAAYNRWNTSDDWVAVVNDSQHNLYQEENDNKPHID